MNKKEKRLYYVVQGIKFCDEVGTDYRTLECFTNYQKAKKYFTDYKRYLKDFGCSKEQGVEYYEVAITIRKESDMFTPYCIFCDYKQIFVKKQKK